MSSESESDIESVSASDSESDTDSTSESGFDTDSTSDSESEFGSESEPESESGRRLAILFGNNAYHVNTPLNSCCKDAKDMAEILAGFGYQVTVVLDAKTELMLKELEEFFKKIWKNDSVLIYYSGHGMETKGKNYLIPIESNSYSEYNVISLNYVMEELKKRGNKLNIIILDACRSGEENDEPKKKTYNEMKPPEPKKTTVPSNEQKPFLQQYAVIYACASQSNASAGCASNNNSTFTGVLLECLREKEDEHSLSLDSILNSVTLKVFMTSKQQPCWYASLTEKFSLDKGWEPFVAIPMLDFDKLNNQKRRIPMICESSAMAANNEYVIYFSKDHLHLVDSTGNKKSKVKQEFLVQDICWSTYQNRFLVLEQDKRVHLFNTQTCQYKLYRQFEKPIRSLTCHEQRLLFVTTSTIEKYNMVELKFIKEFRICKSIEKIRYSSNGKYLGVIVRENLPKTERWFGLLDSSNMAVLRKISLGKDSIGLMSLPDKQFLINRTEKKNFRVINPIDNSEKEISYEKRIRSIALMGDTKHLVIQTTKYLDIQRNKYQQLRSYDLTANEQRE